MNYKVGIITASDSSTKGERPDESGPLIKKIVEENGFTVISSKILPDNIEEIKKEMLRLTDIERVNLVLTTGGTGFSVRDVTPEATTEIVERFAPGISEAIRGYSIGITKRAMLSRGISGIRGQSLIINLPGSPKAVKESLEFIIDTISHGLDILMGNTKDCGNKENG